MKPEESPNYLSFIADIQFICFALLKDYQYIPLLDRGIKAFLSKSLTTKDFTGEMRLFGFPARMEQNMC